MQLATYWVGPANPGSFTEWRGEKVASLSCYEAARDVAAESRTYVPSKAGNTNAAPPFLDPDAQWPRDVAQRVLPDVITGLTTQDFSAGSKRMSLREAIRRLDAALATA